MDANIELFKRWTVDPLSFIEAMIIKPYNEANESSGERIVITSQQREAVKEVGRLVEAKLKKSWGKELTVAEVGLCKKFGVSIMAGKGLGKDGLASWLILWFMMCFPYCKIPCISVSADQLNKVLWSEISKWLSHSPLKEFLILENQKLYYNDPDKDKRGKRWFAFPKTANPKAGIEEQTETLSGVHEDFVMIVIDEASGIPNAVFNPLESTLTKPCNFVFMIFNPTRSTGYAVDTHGKDAAYWIPLRWNAEESEIADKQIIARVEEKYGRDSNPYRIRILGLPPLVDELTLFPSDWVMDAVSRDITPFENSPIVKGLDCGAGGDKSVIVTRKGGKVYSIKRLSTPNSQDLINWALTDYSAENTDIIRVDNIGIGWAVYGTLFDKLGSSVEAADSRKKADNPERFMNKRAEMYWTLKEQFEKGLISIPDDKDLIDQLLATKISYDGGKMRITEKAHIKKTLGHSPDELDALALSYYYDDIFLTKRPHNTYCHQRTIAGGGEANGWLRA